MVDSIITGINEKRFSKNRLVKVHDFRGSRLVDINHHIILILKKKTDVIIFNSVSRTSREIFDDLLQLKSVITKVVPKCQVIFWRSTFRVDNGKTALTLQRLKEDFS